MPRKSAEERAGAVWRSGGALPAPPKHLGREARAVWRETIKSRPVDFFPRGVLPLLEDFCVATVVMRKVTVSIQEDPIDQALVDTFKKFAGIKASLATKLRLVNTASRASGIHDERGGHDPLIGGRS